ncbi:hypothetical protein QOT17_023688 [Balamuthia mandrillaris]
MGRSSSCQQCYYRAGARGGNALFRPHRHMVCGRSPLCWEGTRATTTRLVGGAGRRLRAPHHNNFSSSGSAQLQSRSSLSIRGNLFSPARVPFPSASSSLSLPSPSSSCSSCWSAGGTQPSSSAAHPSVFRFFRLMSTATAATKATATATATKTRSSKSSSSGSTDAVSEAVARRYEMKMKQLVELLKSYEQDVQSLSTRLHQFCSTLDKPPHYFFAVAAPTLGYVDTGKVVTLLFPGHSKSDIQGLSSLAAHMASLLPPYDPEHHLPYQQQPQTQKESAAEKEKKEQDAGGLTLALNGQDQKQQEDKAAMLRQREERMKNFGELVKGIIATWPLESVLLFLQELRVKHNSLHSKEGERWDGRELGILISKIAPHRAKTRDLEFYMDLLVELLTNPEKKGGWGRSTFAPPYPPTTLAEANAASPARNRLVFDTKFAAEVCAYAIGPFVHLNWTFEDYATVVSCLVNAFIHYTRKYYPNGFDKDDELEFVSDLIAETAIASMPSAALVNQLLNRVTNRMEDEEDVDILIHLVHTKLSNHTFTKRLWRKVSSLFTF